MSAEVQIIPVEVFEQIVRDASEVPCRREERGGSHGSAVWAAWIVDDREVCCNPIIPIEEQPMFICDPCLQSWRRSGITCPHCGRPAGSFSEVVTRLDRIKS